MTKIIKTTITATMAIGLLVGLSGCGNTYSQEQINAQVMKHTKYSKNLENIDIKTKFLKKYNLLGIDAEDYTYTLSAKVTSDFCDGFSLWKNRVRQDDCSGRVYRAGNTYTSKGHVSLSKKDVQ